MAKTQSPLLGYNNNVRHKNRVFHIQTEDSGVKHPHIITHLFMDGGRILKSVKRSYAEHLGSDNLSETVRQMMKEQHKQMFIALRDGAYDDLLEGAVRASTAGIPAQAAKPVAPAQASAAPPAQAAAPPAAPAAPPQASAPPKPVAPSRTESPIDMQALEAASLTTGEHAALAMPNDLPPPPKNLFQKELTGNIGYRSTRVDEEEAGRPTPAQQKRPGSRPPPERHGSQPAPDRRNPLARTQPSVAPSPPSRAPAQATAASPSPAPAAARPAPQAAPAASPKPPPQPAVSLPPPTQKDDPGQSRRYAPARPAAIFGQSQAPSTSIFGDDLVGDKSLDEVILSYLVDDLKPQKK
jgi:hypothetical protein